MVKKKSILITVCITAVLAAALAACILIHRGKSNPDIRNVFDEMLEEEYEVLEEAEHVTAGGYDAIRMLWDVKEGTPLKIGIIYSTEYKRLYIYGDASMPEDIRGMSYQEYFEESLNDYGITWEEVEDSKEEFICRTILGTWFTEHKSSYTKDSLGELEVLDFLMPYEYCGKDNSKWKTVTETVEEGYTGAFQGKVRYTEWDAGEIRCRQTQISRDYGYKDIMERVEADMNGFNTVSEDIVVEGKVEKQMPVWRDEDGYVYMGDITTYSFIEWMKNNGKVEGNLTKLAYTREEGEEKTRDMLEQYPEKELIYFLKSADYYIAGDELNIRLAYYDYEAKNPDWLKNGKGEIWQGWITVKIDDAGEFLWLGY